MRLNRRQFLVTGALAAATGSWTARAVDNGGGAGIVLQFDDGWPNWVEVIAPELKKVKGTATGFVCGQYVDSGRVSLKEVKALQDTFGWEIGSHGYHHLNAPRYVQDHGLDTWIEKELVPSLDKLRQAGIEARSLVFPFNAFTPEIARGVRDRVESYRRAVPLAIAEGIQDDGSVPGTTIDIAQYPPVNIVKSWIRFAARKRQLLFLYGHRVLPDDQFFEGTVKKLVDSGIETTETFTPPRGEAMAFVPDMTRRMSRQDIGQVTAVEGKTVAVSGGRQPRVDDRFLIGPSYSTRLSDFRSIIEYAAERMPFYTLHQVSQGVHRE